MEFYLQLTIIILVFSISLSFAAGLVTGNYSQVDRLWSVLPPVYVIIWGIKYYQSMVYLLPAALVVVWGIRLSYNFSRRGGYAFSLRKGFYGEDYRWQYLRRKINSRPVFEIFNFVFISSFQLILVFLFTLPLYYTGKYALQKKIQLSPLHITICSFILLLIIIETIADKQQFNFHSLKKQHNFKPKYGFNTSGLWRYARHPNYACELLIWITFFFYLKTLYSPGLIYGSGAFLLVIVFAGSTALTEKITAAKYPAYREWQKITSPWLPGLKTVLHIKKRKKFLHYS
ncbi:MAG TPA: DUF1295 domain-containing protein [Spirochaetota bacterium]|nr:DUF1295 domain-containing protein [Spirochaetota bacterium]